jgi:hypothetical protein
LLDFSKTFAPYTEQDVSALTEIVATVEDLVRTGQLEQPSKILVAAFGNDGLSPVRPCGPARVFRQKLVQSGTPADGNVTKIKDLHDWLVSCVKTVKALSNDAQQFTDISGALSFAGASNREINGAKILIIYTDFREDLPPGQQPPSFNLKDNGVVIVSRPGLDDTSQPAALLARVADWSDRLKKAGAKRICHSSSQSITKNDIVGCLTKQKPS